MGFSATDPKKIYPRPCFGGGGEEFPQLGQSTHGRAGRGGMAHLRRAGERPAPRREAGAAVPATKEGWSLLWG